MRRTGRHRRVKPAVALKMTSMMDILVVLLLFLVKSFVADEQMSPSAGATTKPGRVGGFRGGCRKNAALAAAEASPARRSQGFRRPAKATARLTPTNGRPSGCIGGTEERTRAASRAGPVLRSGRLAIVQRFYGDGPLA